MTHIHMHRLQGLNVPLHPGFGVELSLQQPHRLKKKKSIFTEAIRIATRSQMYHAHAERDSKLNFDLLWWQKKTPWKQRQVNKQGTKTNLWPLTARQAGTSCVPPKWNGHNERKRQVWTRWAINNIQFLTLTVLITLLHCAEEKISLTGN